MGVRRSLDRGKCKQRKTSGDCSQQLRFGTASQTTASALQGGYLLGSLLSGKNHMWTNISHPHWLIRDGSSQWGSGIINQPRWVLWRERAPAEGCGSGCSYLRYQCHPRIRMPSPARVNNWSESPTCCFCVPAGAVQLVPRHISHLELRDQWGHAEKMGDDLLVKCIHWEKWMMKAMSLLLKSS